MAESDVVYTPEQLSKMRTALTRAENDNDNATILQDSLGMGQAISHEDEYYIF